MNNVSQETNIKKRPNFWLAFILFFPLASICSGITMIYLANTSENSMVQDDWYKAGLAVNVDLAEEEWAQAQQIALKAFITPSNKNSKNNTDIHNAVKIELSSKNSSVLHGKNVELFFEHVTDDARDIKSELHLSTTENSNIIYTGNFNKKLSGTYRIHVKGILDYKPWALTQRFTVPETDSKQWSFDLVALP